MPLRRTQTFHLFFCPSSICIPSQNKTIHFRKHRGGSRFQRRNVAHTAQANTRSHYQSGPYLSDASHRPNSDTTSMPCVHISGPLEDARVKLLIAELKRLVEGTRVHSVLYLGNQQIAEALRDFLLSGLQTPAPGIKSIHVARLEAGPVLLQEIETVRLACSSNLAESSSASSTSAPTTLPRSDVLLLDDACWMMAPPQGSVQHQALALIPSYVQGFLAAASHPIVVMTSPSVQYVPSNVAACATVLHHYRRSDIPPLTLELLDEGAE
jgi:hypothetical protein